MMNAGKQHVQEKHYMKNKRMKVLYFALRPTEILNRTLHSYQHAHNLFLKKTVHFCSLTLHMKLPDHVQDILLVTPTSDMHGKE